MAALWQLQQCHTSVEVISQDDRIVRPSDDAVQQHDSSRIHLQSLAMFSLH